jgi:transcriptional regulator with XRE-family HTH domain
MRPPANDPVDMSRARHARRDGKQAVAGRRRAQSIAGRLGVALRDTRQSSGISQAVAATQAGISQPRWSELERGLGASASLETWAVVAAAVSEQLVGYLEHAPGAERPRDIEHVRRQNAVIEVAHLGGWVARPELAIDTGPARSRSIDVALLREEHHEAAVVEIWDWFDDVGASLRGLDGKKVGLAARLNQARGPSWRVGGLFVIRDTRRNRALTVELRALFAARFSGSSRDWLRALGDGAPAAPMPSLDGYVWSDARGRLIAARTRGPR